MFENPGHPVVFAQFYVGFKLYFLLEKYQTSSNLTSMVMIENPGRLPVIFQTILCWSQPLLFSRKIPDVQ